MEGIPFEERFRPLVDVEYSSRKNNHLKRLVHNAEFDRPSASNADIDYSSGSKLNKALIKRLSDCEYISDCRNIFITGATGIGKSYLACALGREACKHYYNTKYVRFHALLGLKNARKNNCYRKTMEKYVNAILLILDEWLLIKPMEDEQKDIFELLLHRRLRRIGISMGIS